MKLSTENKEKLLAKSKFLIGGFMEEIRYFDNAATTKVKDEVIKTMIPYFWYRIWKSFINV